MNFVFRLARAAYTRSPQANFRRLAQKVAGSRTAPVEPDRYDPLDDVLQSRSLPALLKIALGSLPGSSTLLLVPEGSPPLASLAGANFRIAHWNWGDNVSAAPMENIVIACAPTRPGHWRAVAKLKRQFDARTHTLPELLLPFTQITMLHRKLEYTKPDMDEVFSYYLGERFFGPLEELHALCSLTGKRVFEFGPLDAFQTAGLVKLGAEVDCVEARADNAIKTRAAADAFHWPVRIFMDDFHNANASKYGRYDLAFAHGVYYHSIEPFLFLENLVSLADNIFLGGYCAEGRPSQPAQEVQLQHEGATYRAQRYVEARWCDAGVNAYGYVFYSEDLAEFFRRKKFAIEVISREPAHDERGIYFRFLARRS